MSDFRTTQGESMPLPQSKARSRRRKIALYAASAFAVILALLFLIRIEQKVPATGYVVAEDYAEVRPSIVGRIAEILVETGEEVAAGDELARLDDSEVEALLEQAKNQAERARAQIAKLQEVHKDRKSKHEKAMALAELRFRSAVGKLELAERLNEKGLSSDIALEDSRLAKELAAVELEALKSVGDSIDEKELAVLKEEIKAAENAVKLQRVRLNQYAIRAPISGQAIRHEFAVGEVVGPEIVLYELFGGETLVLKLLIDERHAALIGAGRKYRARLIPFRGLTGAWFRGEVFGTRDIIETRGSRTGKLVFCTFDPGPYDVHPGSSADAELFVGKAPLWRVLLGVYR